MIIRNFLFHRVSDETDLMWPPMKPATFSKIIKFLTQKYCVVSLEHYLDDVTAFKSKKNLATLSFDDGYKDNIDYAAPILKQFTCPASFYIITDCADRNIPPWTYLMDHVFQHTTKDSLYLDFEFVPEVFKSVPLKEKGVTNPVIQKIKPWMKQLSNPKRLQITNAILEQINDVALPQGKMMNWKDIAQLDANEFTIGSHSHTHPMLASLQSEDEIEHELNFSAETIYNHIGKRPETISYPIGSVDERVSRLSAKNSYKYGLAVEQMYYNYPTDIMRIPRVELYEQPWWKIKLHLTGNYWNKARRLVK